jgi:hypothetical protein
MSFSDLMSSGRGPGVIGMVLALIVLLGFGFLFMFASDEGLQGADQSIESVIRSQERELRHHQEKIGHGASLLQEGPARTSRVKELSLMKRMNQGHQDRVAELKKGIDAANSLLEEGMAEIETYKNRYRAHVRSLAKGSEIEELKTMDGVSYQKVNIREVTAVGIQIRHDGGQKRIPFENLPEEMRDHFQFDPNQKAQALALESQQRAVHEAAATVANAAADEQMVIQRAKEAALMRENLMRQVERKEAIIDGLEDEIRLLEREMQNAEAAAASARSAGRMHINKSGSHAANIRSKRSRISAIRNEIQQMRSRL